MPIAVREGPTAITSFAVVTSSTSYIANASSPVKPITIKAFIIIETFIVDAAKFIIAAKVTRSVSLAVNHTNQIITRTIFRPSPLKVPFTFHTHTMVIITDDGDDSFIVLIISNHAAGSTGFEIVTLFISIQNPCLFFFLAIRALYYFKLQMNNTDLYLNLNFSAFFPIILPFYLTINFASFASASLKYPRTRFCLTETKPSTTSVAADSSNSYHSPPNFYIFSAILLSNASIILNTPHIATFPHFFRSSNFLLHFSSNPMATRNFAFISTSTQNLTVFC